MKVDRCLRHSGLTSAVKLVVLIYYRSMVNFAADGDGIFGIEMTAMTQPLHAPDAAPSPVRLLPLVLQRFAIIDAHAE